MIALRQKGRTLFLLNTLTTFCRIIYIMYTYLLQNGLRKHLMCLFYAVTLANQGEINHDSKHK